MWNGQIFNFIHKINFTGFVTAEHTHTHIYTGCGNVYEIRGLLPLLKFLYSGVR